jgi:hypothetical protein
VSLSGSKARFCAALDVVTWCCVRLALWLALSRSRHVSQSLKLELLGMILLHHGFVHFLEDDEASMYEFTVLFVHGYIDQQNTWERPRDKLLNMEMS